MKKAFTLIEVNLAILVMAGGILSVVVLYSLGFRETRQSREDIASAAYADAVLSPLVAALSSDELTWDDFDSVQSTPAGGWGGYVNQGTGAIQMKQDAASVFSTVASKLKSSKVDPSYPGEDCGLPYAGLVVCHESGEAIVRIGFRAAKKQNTLLSAPLYYTEVAFQGKYKDN